MAVIETTPIFDIFCSGFANVERLPGDLLRLWCYAEQAANGEGPTEQVLVAKIVIPASAMPAAIGLVTASLGPPKAKVIPYNSRNLMNIAALIMSVGMAFGAVGKASTIGGTPLHSPQDRPAQTYLKHSDQRL